MKTLHTNDVRNWLQQSNSLHECLQSIGIKQLDHEYTSGTLGIPLHLQFLGRQLVQDNDGPSLAANALDSIPFYSLCRGLFLPLSFLDPQKVAQVFGLIVDPPPDAAGRERLVAQFLEKDIGLSLVEKFGCILGDPFFGKKSYMRRDSLLRLLTSMQLYSRTALLDRLTHVGDVAVLFAENRPTLKPEQPLTAAEVLRLLRFLPEQRSTARFALLRSLLDRCGKLEAYFIAKLLLRKAGFGFDYQGPLLAKTLATKFNVHEEQVAHALALTDIFYVSNALETQGAEGLRAIHMQPLVPVKPALAGGTTDEVAKYPVWVERKYDGIRLMLHKSSDDRGSVLCGAYTRSRGDWLEMIPGLDHSIKLLSAQNAILDGELYGTTFDMDAVRPASVYEVYAALQSQPTRPVNLKYAAFDLLYLNGVDLTELPLSERRQRLSNLIAPLAMFSSSLPIPITLAEGQLASSKDDVNRLYQHFRSQGYEGVITKDLSQPYCLAARDPNWRKRKPEITLDLVLVGAIYAVTTKENAGLFGSYVIGARQADGSFLDVGDVAGVDRLRDAELQTEIVRNGLLTGRRIERNSSSGTRPGVELHPSIVVTVKFEGIVHDQVTRALSLRDPKLAMIRSDKSSHEADTVSGIEEIYLRQRMG